MRSRIIRCLAGVCAGVGLGLVVAGARAQTFRYEAEPRAGEFDLSYAAGDAAPRLMSAPETRPTHSDRGERVYRDPRFRRRPAARGTYGRRARPYAGDDVLLTASGEPIPPGVPVEPFAEDAPPGPPGPGYEESYDGDGYEPDLEGGPFLDEPPCGGCGHCDDCDPCGECYLHRWCDGLCSTAAHGGFCENLQLITGKQGFKGPVDLGVNGDFGYHFAFNWGMPLFDSLGVGYQLGGNWILSDFEGRSGPLGHRRSQWFLTTGLFHRAMGEQGFQGGAVVDYLYDSFYVRMNLWQVRGEVSYVWCQHEVGFWGAIHANTNTQRTSIFPDEPAETFSFEGTDQYTAFYRYQFCNGTVCRTWAGLSGYADGIFGGDATVRVSERWGLIAAYNYLLPRNHEGVPNNVTESWNLTISFVWYPGYKRCDSWLNPYRPLFYAADNGWFLVRDAN
ncbi:MAG: DUF6666 family protein [Pirellulales bacterium]